jgi:dephospho-CoA kinase
MFLVGLTGGIASGKSTVSSMLAKFDNEIIDADQVAREVVEPGTEGLSRVVEEFGEQVLDSNGSLDRAKLAKLVFSDANKRVALEGILHPLIKARTLQLIRNSKKGIVIYVVPLLVEAGVDYPFDFVVTVEAGVKNQVQRLIDWRGMSRQEALDRIKSQASEGQRVSRADVRLDSSLSLADLEQAVSQLWAEIQSKAAVKAGHGAN